MIETVLSRSRLTPAMRLVPTYIADAREPPRVSLGGSHLLAGIWIKEATTWLSKQRLGRPRRL
jgi:hypothetical protein